MLKEKQAGFTLIEISIVLALTAFLGYVLAGSFKSNNRIETFNTSIQELASYIRETQSKSYAVERPSTGETARGSFLNFEPTNNVARRSLLYGFSLERNSQNQRAGIVGREITPDVFDFTTKELDLRSVVYDVSGSMDDSSGSLIRDKSTSGLTGLASLSPNGQGYLLHGTTVSDPSNYHSGSIKVFICELSNRSNKLTARVTINTISGIIETEVGGNLVAC